MVDNDTFQKLSFAILEFEAVTKIYIHKWSWKYEKTEFSTQCHHERGILIITFSEFSWTIEFTKFEDKFCER